MPEDRFTIVSDMTRFLTDLEKAAQLTARLRREQDLIIRSAKSEQEAYQWLTKHIDINASKLNKAIGVVNRSRTALLGATQATRDFSISWQTMARLTGSMLISRAITAFTTALRDGLEASREFEKQLAAVQTIDKRGLSLDNWARQIRELSDAWGTDIIDQTRAAYQALSNQVVDGSEAMEFLTAANQLAVTGLSTTEDAVKILSSAINSFELDAGDAQRVAAQLFKTVELGRNKIEEIADSYGRVAKPAAQLNVRFEEVNAALAALTRQGVKPQEAMTQLNGIFIKLLKPTTKLKAFIQELGYESAEAAIDVLGFGGFLQKLDEKVRGSSTELAKYINRQRGLRGILTLTGTGLKLYGDNLEQITKSSDTFGSKTNIILSTASKKFEIEMNKIRNAFVDDFGRSAFTTLAKLTNDFKIISGIVTLLAGNIEFLLLPVIGMVTTALARMAWTMALSFKTNPILAILPALGLVAAGIYKVIDALGEQMREQDRLAEEGIEQIERVNSLRLRADEKRVSETIELLKAQKRETARLLEDINRLYYRHTNGIVDNYASTAKEIKDAIGDVAKAMRQNVSDLDSEIDRLTKHIQEAPKALRELESSFRDLIFESQQRERDPAAQFASLVARYRQQQEMLRGAVTREQFEDISKEIIDTLGEISRMQSDIDSDNARATEGHIKRQARMRDETERYEKARRSILNQIVAAQRAQTGRTEKLVELNIRLAELDRDYSQKMAEHKTELDELKTVDIERFNVAKEATAELERQKALLQSISEQERANLEAAKARQKVASLELAQYEEMVRQYPVTQEGLKALTKIEDIDELKDKFEGSLKLIEETQKNLALIGDTPETRRQFTELEKAKASFQAIYDLRVKHLALTKQLQDAEDKRNALIAKEKELQEQNAALSQRKLDTAKKARELANSLKAPFDLPASFTDPYLEITKADMALYETIQRVGQLSKLLRLITTETGGSIPESLASKIQPLAQSLRDEFARLPTSTDEQVKARKEALAPLEELFELLAQEEGGVKIADWNTRIRENRQVIDENKKLMEDVNALLDIQKDRLSTFKTEQDDYSTVMQRATLSAYEAQTAFLGLIDSINQMRAAAAAATVTPIPTVAPPQSAPLPTQAKPVPKTIGTRPSTGSAPPGVQVGDINVNVQGMNDPETMATKVGKALRRDIRRGRLVLT